MIVVIELSNTVMGERNYHLDKSAYTYDLHRAHVTTQMCQKSTENKHAKEGIKYVR